MTIRPDTTLDGVPARRVAISPGDVWRAGLVLLAVVALGGFGWFVLTDAGQVLFTILMAWFTSIAMEPAIRRLSPYMSRAKAASLVMVAVAVFLVVFLVAFGRLFVEQIAAVVRLLPDLVQQAIDWANRTFSTSYSIEGILESIRLTPDQAAKYANDVLGGVLGLLGLLGSVVAGLFGVFTFVLLTFYFAADGPRLRLWIASLLPARMQEVFVAAWDLTTVKTGGYVSARVVLAAINGGSSALVFLAIGMPSWLALGIWTGLVAQFVPTIGTYISIVLPVLVGLLSPSPWIGLAALAWAIVYQQVENLTIEPRISARAVNVHPAVAFASVLLGTALFGVAGALVSIPVVAVLLALLDIFGHRHELLPALQDEAELHDDDREDDNDDEKHDDEKHEDDEDDRARQPS